MQAEPATSLENLRAANATHPIRVMIVDDSAVARGLLSRWVEEEPELELVARHANGRLAVEDLEASAPDIVVLDIEMPVMDGFEALPLLLKAKPGLRVLMASALTRRNAEISLKALALGAVDYVPKPGSNRDLTMSTDFRLELIRKLIGLGRPTKPMPPRAEFAVGATSGHPSAAYATRPFSLVPPRILAIGSSTGGPEALAALLVPLAPALAKVAVVIAQHMPPVFTAVLAARLGQLTGRDAREAVDGDVLKPGTIYVAPGDRHLTVAPAQAPSLRLGDGPPVNFCKPAVDPLFASVAEAYGPAALGIVLTGMGSDGAAGAGAIAKAGGSVIAQDEASSVVWGMPGAAARTGNCSALLPPRGIANAVSMLLRGMRP